MHPDEPVTILVTGGAGFVGSAFCRRALGVPGVRIAVLARMARPFARATLAPILATGRATLETGDVADRGAVARAFAVHRPDAVVHLAAETQVDRSIDGPLAFVRTNLLGTQTMLEAASAHRDALPAAARDRFRFVHVSTDAVFGALGDAGRFDESAASAPRSPYAATKAGAEHMARAFHRTHGLPVVVTNGSNTYGPWQSPDALVPLAILDAIEDRPLRLYGSGDQRRDWLHVDDHAEGLWAALTRGTPGERYALGGTGERTNAEVMAAICRRLDVRRPDRAPHARLVVHVAERPGDDRRRAVDATRAARDLGWRPRRDVAAGLADTVDWYLANEDWWRPARSRDDGRTRHGLMARGLRVVA
jgi:dTDP-glucose 4,6-dehydratase